MTHLADNPIVVSGEEVADHSLVDPGLLTGRGLQAHLLEVIGSTRPSLDQLPARIFSCSR